MTPSKNEWQNGWCLRPRSLSACHARIAILRADRRGANSCESFVLGGIDFVFATPLQVDGSCENAEQHDLHRTQMKLTGQLVHETADEISRFSRSNDNSFGLSIGASADKHKRNTKSSFSLQNQTLAIYL